MNVDLISFQERAVRDLRADVADALDAYRRRGKTQVVSLQAPTGAGKTIIAAALIEGIYNGMTMADGITTYDAQPDAIFVWLSDSPELNAQSADKIKLKTSRLRIGQCITIEEKSFDREMLEDGHIYFLNTQKISRSGNLSRHSDNRQYTIWETLDNTVANKSDRLYFIIDEAHRGAKSKREAGTDTTIMQRFIRGYTYQENGVTRKMRAMPLVIGISATAERFNTLVSNIPNVGMQTCVIAPEEVRASGLLKDRIVITYPEDPEKNNDMVLLGAAVDEWMKKCRRWYQYTSEQHYANVDPVLVVQVCPGSGAALSDTDLDDVLAKIEEKTGAPFREGEVVHCFGEGARLNIGGLPVPYIRASDIAGDHRVRVVLFKEALSTGWDCPRAETMMSFAVRNDPTYIAQLLGRMVRTPLQMRVARDEFLNDVKLYLPHFSRDNVRRVVDELQANEGGDIPTEIDGQSLEEPAYITYTVHTKKIVRRPEEVPGQISILDPTAEEETAPEVPGGGQEPFVSVPEAPSVPAAPTVPEPPAAPLAPGEERTVTLPAPEVHPRPFAPPAPGKQLTVRLEFDRAEVIDFINRQAFLTYLVRQDRINDYLKSLLNMAVLLTHSAVCPEARDEVIDDVVGMIHAYIGELRAAGRYGALSDQVLEYRLSVQVYDPFGNVVRDGDSDRLTLISETDIDRQLRNADARLGGFGFPGHYYRAYGDEDLFTYKIDCILFAADDYCREKLGEYAKDKLHEFVRRYRLAIVNKSDACKKKYHDILADSDAVSEQNFTVPEDMVVKEDPDGAVYDNHLLASEETGLAKIRLNGWEAELIEAEARRPDFVCWLRNPAKARWALCLPYETGGVKKKFYPDFLIVRSDAALSYIVDILEPHGDQYADNLPKAKALADYARKEERIGRIQLIRKGTDAAGKSRFRRIDLTDPATRERVLHANSDDELKNVFADCGFFE